MDKRLVVFMAAASFAATPALAADVGVSISIGQPGFFGHLDIGDFPQPRVVYQQPVIVTPVPEAGPPVYLRVPPGHIKHWNKHCAEYHACGERVYFVRDDWYSNVYAPRYRERHEYRNERREEWRDRHDHDDHDHDGHDHHEHRHGHDRDDH